MEGKIDKGLDRGILEEGQEGRWRGAEQWNRGGERARGS